MYPLVVFVLNSSGLYLIAHFFQTSHMPSVPFSEARRYSFSVERPVLGRIVRRYYRETYLYRRVQWTELVIAYSLWVCLTAVFLRGLLHTSAWALVFAWLLPIGILEYLRDRAESAIDGGIIPFMTHLNARLAHTGDLLAAMDAARRATDTPYIGYSLNAFHRGVQMGLDPIQAFARIQDEIHHPYLSYVFVNIEQGYRRRAHIEALMQALLNEYIAIQVELNKRKIELRHERRLTAISLILVLGTGLKMLGDHGDMLVFFRDHPVLLGILGAIAGVGAIIFIRALAHGE